MGQHKQKKTHIATKKRLRCCTAMLQTQRSNNATNNKKCNAMYNNYSLQHVTLRTATYTQLQAAVSALKAQARKRKQTVKQRFIHVNLRDCTAKFTLASKNIATLTQ
jgi:hypothetical protein